MSFFSLRKSSLGGEWSRDQQIFPHVVRNPDGTITLHHVRDLKYRSESDFEVRFQERVIDPRSVTSVELVIAPFWGLEIAHTFLLFHFRGAESLALSIEARRKKDQRFSLWALFPFQFRLMFVWGTERDVLRLRTRVWRIKVERLRLDITPEKACSIFERAITRTEELERRDEWYNMITNNCVNNIISFFRGSKVSIPRFHWRYVLSSKIAQVFQARGLVRDMSNKKTLSKDDGSILKRMEDPQPPSGPHTEGRFMIKNPTIRKTVGTILIIIGLLALVTPLTPGAWIGLIGLEMLGLHMTVMKPIREWLERRGWWR